MHYRHIGHPWMHFLHLRREKPSRQDISFIVLGPFLCDIFCWHFLYLYVSLLKCEVDTVPVLDSELNLWNLAGVGNDMEIFRKSSKLVSDKCWRRWDATRWIRTLTPLLRIFCQLPENWPMISCQLHIRTGKNCCYAAATKRNCRRCDETRLCQCRCIAS